MDVVFRKYKNGMISYEVEGPIEPRPVGEKIDKFGRSIVEILLIGAAVAALLSLGIFWPVPIALGVVGLLLGFLAER
jgi:hypothetical protein